MARWLVEQNGGRESISLNFSQVVRAATGKIVVPHNPADEKDVAAVAKIGAALDAILPRMNRPDSPAHAAAREGATEEIVTAFEKDLRAALKIPASATQNEGVAANAQNYPALRWTDAATGKAYYLSVAIYPAGQQDQISRDSSVARALSIRPADLARRLTADGCCLLVGIESDGKMGPGLAFLNWELIDLANLPLRLSATFDADGRDLHPAGVVITDGRKGRD